MAHKAARPEQSGLYLISTVGSVPRACKVFFAVALFYQDNFTPFLRVSGRNCSSAPRRQLRNDARRHAKPLKQATFAARLKSVSIGAFG